MTWCGNCEGMMQSGLKHNLCIRCFNKEQKEHHCLYRTELDKLKTEMDRLLEGYRNDYKK